MAESGCGWKIDAAADKYKELFQLRAAAKKKADTARVNGVY